MIHIAVCDDEQEELKTICGILSQYSENHRDFLLSVSRYQSGRDLWEDVSHGKKYDIYILDIIMDDMNGIKTGEHIRDVDADAFIIYLSFSPDYALQSYSVWAFSYLLKPVDYEKLAVCLDRAIHKSLQEARLCFPFKTPDTLVSVPFSSLVYMEYQAHYLYIHLSDGRILRSTALSVSFDNAIEPLLKDSRFVKTSISFVLNLNYVSSLNHRDFSLSTGGLVPVSRSYYKTVKYKYLRFILEKGSG